jgi:hypothetical protein
LDTAAEEQRVNHQVEILTRLAADTNVNFWADEARYRAIVQFQDRAVQDRELIGFCRSMLGMVYNAMFPRNPQRKSFSELMEKFKDMRDIHIFIKAQLVAGAKFALAWLKIHHPKIDLEEVAKGVLLKSSKRRIKLDRYIDSVIGTSEKMIDTLLEMDKNFFKEFRYDVETKQMQSSTVNIDRFV